MKEWYVAASEWGNAAGQWLRVRCIDEAFIETN